MYFYLIDVLSIIFEAFIIFIFFNTIGISKIKKWIKISCYSLFIIVLCFVYYFIDLVWIKVLLLFIFIYLLSLLHDISARFRWLSVLLLFIIINAVEMLVGFIMSAVFSMTVKAIQDTILYYTVGVLASKTLTLLVVKLIQFNKKSNDIKVSKSIIALYSIFPVITLSVGVILISGFGTNIDPTYSVIGAIAEILLVIANISVFYIFEIYARKSTKQFELELEQSQLIIQTQYLEEKIEKQTISAKEMHDLKNQLFAIRSLINEDPDKGARKIDELCQIVEGMQRIVYTTNVSIDSLINSKKKFIDEYNIEFKCECFISGFDGIDIIDICILLGNLMDNAIEACLKINSKRSIKLSFKQVDSYLNITVKNTYFNEGNDELVTTKENKFNHGYGIKSVKSIVKKYGGDFQIIKDNDYFIVSILLKNYNNVNNE